MTARFSQRWLTASTERAPLSRPAHLEAHVDRKLIDLYFKKSVRARWNNRRVQIDIPLDVFSSYRIDLGTLFLLKEISSHKREWARALDLGCGYGPVHELMLVGAHRHLKENARCGSSLCVLIAVALREREGYEVHLGKVSHALAEYPDSTLVLAGASGKAARLEKALRKMRRRISFRAKRKGFCAFVVNR